MRGTSGAAGNSARSNHSLPSWLPRARMRTGASFSASGEVSVTVSTCRRSFMSTESDLGAAPSGSLRHAVAGS